MFFLASKLLWIVAAPTNLMAGVAGLGSLLVLIGLTRPGLRLVFGAVLALLLFGFLPVGTLILRPLEDRFPQASLEGLQPDGIVVLGGAIDQVTGAARGQVTISDSATRITAAAALARRFSNARLVYTGGSNALVSVIGGEAEDARRLWVSLGVDPARITIEDRSRNTDENARFVRDLLRPTPGQTWILDHLGLPYAPLRWASSGPLDFPVVPYPGGLPHDRDMARCRAEPAAERRPVTARFRHARMDRSRGLQALGQDRRCVPVALTALPRPRRADRASRPTEHRRRTGGPERPGRRRAW